MPSQDKVTLGAALCTGGGSLVGVYICYVICAITAIVVIYVTIMTAGFGGMSVYAYFVSDGNSESGTWICDENEKTGIVEEITQQRIIVRFSGGRKAKLGYRSDVNESQIVTVYPNCTFSCVTQKPMYGDDYKWNVQDAENDCPMNIAFVVIGFVLMCIFAIFLTVICIVSLVVAIFAPGAVLTGICGLAVAGCGDCEDIDFDLDVFDK